MDLAARVFVPLRATPGAQRARMLRGFVQRVEALGDQLLETAHRETALPMTRLQAERARMCLQATIFAARAETGDWQDPVIRQSGDAPVGERQEARGALAPIQGSSKTAPTPSPTPDSPHPDIRTINRPIGPVVVFGASNFPLAISVAGTDTVAALAVGCPVVAKAHPGHPATCDLVGGALIAAAKDAGLPAATFQMLMAEKYDVGQALVRHPATSAVAFTGSLRGGRALMDIAAARPSPIPVYAEMGSVNPVVMLPGAFTDSYSTVDTPPADRDAPTELAAGFIASLTMGVGQYCTNPGLVFGIKSPGWVAFETAVHALAKDTAPATMLTPGIQAAYGAGVRHRAGRLGPPNQPLPQAPQKNFPKDLKKNLQTGFQTDLLPRRQRPSPNVKPASKPPSRRGRTRYVALRFFPAPARLFEPIKTT